MPPWTCTCCTFGHGGKLLVTYARPPKVRPSADLLPPPDTRIGVLDMIKATLTRASFLSRRSVRWIRNGV